MKGDKGVCTNEDLIRKTKFDTMENAKNARIAMVRIDVMTPDNVIYQCKTCEMWHIAKPELAKQYSK